MDRIEEQNANHVHPLVKEAEGLYRKGSMGRREFLRLATLLGMSLAGANTLLAGCAAEPTPAPAEEATSAPTSPPEETGGPKRGGVLTCATLVLGVDHPARMSKMHVSNCLRHVCEYLTVTDWDNITHPLLLERWEVSDDLKTWTLYLRQGIKWNNADDFTSDDVIFTMKEWLDPEIGSSMRGLMSYLTPDGIEKVDEHTVKLHLDSGQVAVPEHLFHYPALILNHRTFEGSILDAPVGTGPYTLSDYVVGERVVLKAREDYWQTGADGEPLPYLDEINYVDLGEDQTAWVSAFKSGQIDTMFQTEPATWQALKDDAEAKVSAVTTSRVNVLRMRTDVEPWTDERVRLALKLCQDRERILELSFFGEGAVGQDHHVAPVHPEYCEIETPDYDPERAKELLAEAGFPDGLEFDLAVSSGRPYIVSHAEALKELAEPGGFRINLNTMPESQYGQSWTEHVVGITEWGHRPLAVMMLPLAYACGEDGEPVAWNETGWCDDEFNELLQQAQATIDLEERREIMCQLETIQQERGSIGIAFWQNVWGIIRKGFQAYRIHPSFYDLWNEVWFDPEA